MADNPNPNLEQKPPLLAPRKRASKRRAFLIGGVAVVGAGLFGIKLADSNAAKKAVALTTGKGEHNFATWLKIAEDDQITIYSPHTDIGQGSNTGLAQMLAEELDAAWDKVKLVSAPADAAFANTGLGRGFLAEMTGQPGIINGIPQSFLSFIARSMNLQTTGGSSAAALHRTSDLPEGWRGDAAALVEVAAKRLGVPAGELTTADSKVIHAKSGKALALWRIGGGGSDAVARQ